MSIIKKTRILLVAFLMLGLSAKSQNFVRFFTSLDEPYHTRSVSGVSYNFFVGEDQETLETSINGLGSGFIDIFDGSVTLDFLTIGTENVSLNLAFGYSIDKYRFSNPLLFETIDGITSPYFDEDPAHTFHNTFFSYEKSKILISWFRLPVNFVISTKYFVMSGGAFYDFYLAGKQKYKYMEDGGKQRLKIKNNKFQDYGFNRVKTGVYWRIHTPKGYGIDLQYMLTPLWDQNKTIGLNANEVKVTFVLPFLMEDTKKDKKKLWDFGNDDDDYEL